MSWRVMAWLGTAWQGIAAQRINAYNNNNHFITYMHHFGPLIRFPSGRFPQTGSGTTFRNRFGVPVRDMCLKQRFRSPPVASLLAMPSHIDSAIWTKGLRFLVLSLQKRSAGSSGRPPKNTTLTKAKTHLVRPGQGPRKLCFICFRTDNIRPKPKSQFFLKSTGVAFDKSALWL